MQFIYFYYVQTVDHWTIRLRYVHVCEWDNVMAIDVHVCFLPQFDVGYQRLKGKRCLFPFGFHFCHERIVQV